MADSESTREAAVGNDESTEERGASFFTRYSWQEATMRESQRKGQPKPVVLLFLIDQTEQGTAEEMKSIDSC
jgi:hypothetical protein